jgi:hypothetical protein
MIQAAEMTQSEADSRFGEIVHNTNSFVVRVKREGPAITVYTHRVENGAEVLPRGYLMGANVSKMGAV